MSASVTQVGGRAVALNREVTRRSRPCVPDSTALPPLDPCVGVRGLGDRLLRQLERTGLRRGVVDVARWPMPLDRSVSTAIRLLAADAVSARVLRPHPTSRGSRSRYTSPGVIGRRRWGDQGDMNSLREWTLPIARRYRHRDVSPRRGRGCRGSSGADTTGSPTRRHASGFAGGAGASAADRVLRPAVRAHPDRDRRLRAAPYRRSVRPPRWCRRDRAAP